MSNNVVKPKNPKPPVKPWNFYGIIYSNNSMGLRCLNTFKDMATDLIEFRLNNIRFSQRTQVLERLTDILISPTMSPFLMKLSLSNVNLSEMKICEAVADLLHAKKYLQYVDLSWSSLSPKQLEMITRVLVEMQTQLRDVNLSYNKLSFHDERSSAFKYSVASISNLKLLLKKARILNHVNFSGMNIEWSRLLDLCQCIVKAPLIMGVHLSDNNISQRMEYFLEILDVFDMTLRDIPRRRIDEIDADYVEQEDMGDEANKAFRDRLNIQSEIQKYMRYSCPEGGTAGRKKVDTNNIINAKAKLLQEDVMLGKELRDCEN